MNEITVTYHAWEQYCLRVGQIDRDELTQLLTNQLRQTYRRKRDLICLEGIWWVYDNNTFITCYGGSHLDLPAAIGWAVQHNDRIPLNGN